MQDSPVPRCRKSRLVGLCCCFFQITMNATTETVVALLVWTLQAASCASATLGTSLMMISYFAKVSQVLSCWSKLKQKITMTKRKQNKENADLTWACDLQSQQVTQMFVSGKGNLLRSFGGGGVHLPLFPSNCDPISEQWGNYKKP